LFSNFGGRERERDRRAFSSSPVRSTHERRERERERERERLRGHLLVERIFFLIKERRERTHRERKKSALFK
jgi:hypothetical protein